MDSYDVGIEQMLVYAMYWEFIATQCPMVDAHNISGLPNNVLNQSCGISDALLRGWFVLNRQCTLS